MYAVRQLQRQVGQYSSTIELTYQPVSHDFWFRRDVDSIFLITFIFVLFGIWTCNLITSFVKKGGLFGGLL